QGTARAAVRRCAKRRSPTCRRASQVEADNDQQSRAGALLAAVNSVPERNPALRDPVEDPIGLGLRELLVVDELRQARLQVGGELLCELVLADVPVVGQVGNLLTLLQVGDQRPLWDAEDVRL